MTLTHRGVNYDVGTNYLPGGALSRQEWRPESMRQEIAAIRDELHCTSVGVYGTDIDRLTQTARVALEHGLHVWLQPRLIDAGAADTLDHLDTAARAAETLREEHPDVHFNVGCELSVFSHGIIDGDDYGERSAKLSSPRTWIKFPWINRRLNDLLGKAAAVARSRFGGRITYGAGLWEGVRWEPFDVIGLDYYRVPYNRSRYVTNLRKLRRHGKPVVIVEFGCAAYEDAVRLGPSAHEIIDHVTGEITGDHVRDEHVQAGQIAELLAVYQAENLHGAFVFEFIEPGHPHSADPRHDLDMAGYGLVKVIPGDDGGYRWEPKAAFHRVAEFYSAA
ncbi:hypothetical protein [Streptosporangium sp. KLBMP 9127]|nr:hypothetical protein [Streptosporangium sp. KLBMP 9127]